MPAAGSDDLSRGKPENGSGEFFGRRKRMGPTQELEFFRESHPKS